MEQSIANLFFKAEPYKVSELETYKSIEGKLSTKKENISVDKLIKSKKTSIEDKLKAIEAEVTRILGKYKKDTLVIKTKEEFVSYIDSAIENGIIAIDTETNNSLDPLTCKLMGPCIYTPGLKNAYIPINHVDENGVRYAWQITENDVKEQFERLSNTKIIMHNAKFDYEVIKCTCNVSLHVYWDTMLAARLLNENERAGLKEQYRTKLDPGQEKYDIEGLFTNIEYAVVPPELFALYAATDSFITYKLYEWQKREFEKPGMDKLYKLFMEVEMPVFKVAAHMELTGICLDLNYTKILSQKYKDKDEEITKKIQEELSKLKPQIDAWKLTPEATAHSINEDGKETKSKAEQLEDPVNTASPVQLAILLYDVLKVKSVSKKSPRGTGADILEALDLPICKLIVEQREINKLANTYIDKLPQCISPKDGRLHAHFNQLGTDTGRFSSSDPNLQNIPSHENSIRMMFVPSDGYAMVGADFSQQEPRLLANFSKDEHMVDAYMNNKDLYATIGVGVYHNDYWENMEHNPDGSPNVEGKKRRKKMKVVYLGVSYGMGATKLADSLGIKPEEAAEILDNFYDSFSGIKTWKDETEAFAVENGYVEDLWGRRRRLVDLGLPEYEITLKNAPKNTEFNPLFKARGVIQLEKPKQVVKYEKLIKTARKKQEKDSIKSQAALEGVTILDNTGKISAAKRQATNARIQGSAATMSKRAMITVDNDPKMKELGFRLLLAVHDELIGECPKENAEAVAERLSEIMINAGKPECTIPMKCDAEIEPRWYYSDYTADISKRLGEKLKSGTSRENAIKEIISESPESVIVNFDELE